MANLPSLTAEERAVWRAYQRMSVSVFSRLNRELLQEARISLPDYEVLVTLMDSPERRLRAFELGAELQWEKSRLSHHLKRMENRGLVERMVCESDGRGLWVGLTAAGVASIGTATPIHDETVKRLLLDAMERPQQALLVELSEKVSASIPADTEEACSD